MTNTGHNVIIPYTPELRLRSRRLRNGSTLGEVILWKHIKGRALGWQFHRQVPMDKFIVDFYCHELFLAIEVDGSSHDNKQDYDQNRQARLEGLGVRFIRFTEGDVRNNITGVLNALQEKINDCAEGRVPVVHVRRSRRVASAQASHPPAPL